MKYIASVSWGKDSLAMLIKILEYKMPLDEVVFFDTGMEFQAIYDVRDKIIPILVERGIKYTELKPRNPFLYDMLERPVYSKQKGNHLGYGWCGGRCRWGTTEKLKAIDAYAEDRSAYTYVGIAADEQNRIAKERKWYKILPLINFKMTESDCLSLCYQYGFQWIEQDVRLYDILDRVSCWCCCNKNLKELRNIYQYLPEYWEHLKELQSKIKRPFKGFYKGNPVGIFELEDRFKANR